MFVCVCVSVCACVGERVCVDDGGRACSVLQCVEICCSMLQCVECVTL